MDVSLPHPTSILGVKICDQETGTNLHTQERPKDLNAPAAHRPSVTFSWPYLSYASWYLCACTPFLVGAICHLLLSPSPVTFSFLVGAICYVFWLALLSPSPVTFSFLSCCLWQTQKHGVTHPHRPPTIMMNRCSFDGCENTPTNNGNGRCRTHGGRTKCDHLGCDSFAQKGGKCGRHRPDKICCSATGCTNLPQKNGVCKIHGGTQICVVHGCTRRLFQSRTCKHHFKNLIVCTAIN